MQENCILVKLIMLGQHGSGKTAIMNRFLNNTFSYDYEPTFGISSPLYFLFRLGASFKTKKIPIENTDYFLRFDVWDTAGQEVYQPHYFNFHFLGLQKEAKAAIVVFDITSRESFKESKYWVNELHNSVPEITIFLAANKCDLFEKQDIYEGEISDYAKQVNSSYKFTSAKDNIGIDEVFFSLAQTIAKTINPKLVLFPGRINSIRLSISLLL